MGYQTEIRGMRFYKRDDGRKPFVKLALAEIYIPEISANIAGVILTWSPKKGWRAHAPYSRKDASPAIQWNHAGAFALDLAEKLRKMYEGMGGIEPEAAMRDAAARRRIGEKKAKPEPKRQFIPLSDLELSEDEGLPLRERVEDALEAESRKRGVPCFTEMWERTEPETEADDDEATDGLRRVLGINPAVSEAMEQAGL